MAKIHPECAAWVETHDGARVKVHSVGYVNAERSGGRLGIYVFALHRKIQAWGVPFAYSYPGSVDEFATMPEFNMSLQGGGFDPTKGQRGPFKVQMQDAFVDGMGLPLNRHVIYIVTFHLVDAPF